jgi:hypothetical protein
MSLNRREVLSNLASILATTTGITTVVRTYRDIDIMKYASTALPLIELQEPDEAPDEEMTSMMQIAFLDMKARVWFITWGENPTSAYEALVQAVRNKIGANFKLNDTATGCWVVGVGKIEGEMPLFHFDLALRLKYYLSLQDV